MSNIRRIIMASAFALALVPGVAQAEDNSSGGGTSYGTGSTPSATTTGGSVGADAVINLDGFCADTVVTVSVDGVAVGTVTTNAKGTATFTIPGSKLPKGVANHVVTTTGKGSSECAATASLGATATPGAASPATLSGNLPVTGQDALSTLQMAAIIAGVGVLLTAVVGIRRRNGNDSAALPGV